MTATAGDPYFNLPGGAKMLGLYFQDDWRVKPNLTFNLGMRWDKDFNLIGTKAQEKSRTYLALKAINHPAAASLPKDDSKDFSPRVGFAWDIGSTGRHVLRGGYGLYYGQTFLNIPLFMIQQINPTIFVSVFSIASGDIVPGTGIPLSNWRFGIDPFPTIPPPPTQLPDNSTGRIMDPDYQNPLTQQWNVGYSWQFNSYSVLEFEYTHILGLHESKTVNINPTRAIFQQMLFSKIVPNCKKLGLLDRNDAWLRRRFEEMGVIQFEDWADTGEEYVAFALDQAEPPEPVTG